MEFMKINPPEISSELQALIDELKIHEARKENESDSSYVRRYYLHPLEREYRELPAELRAWIDENISLKAAILLMLTADIYNLAELREKVEEIENSVNVEAELAPMRDGLLYALFLHKEDETIDGVHANLVSSSLANAWNDRQQKRADRGGEALARIEDIKKIKIVALDHLIYPLDKVNFRIWSLLETDVKKQIPLKAEASGSEKEINLLYSIDFDALENDAKITKQLTQFDKRVYIAISALYNAGNTVTTLQQIHSTMGNVGRASDNQRQKISSALNKMQSAMISISNIEEIQAKYKYPRFEYKGMLLPIERVRSIVNGNVVEEAIHVYREPPAMTFARQREQITTISLAVLNSPMSKTESNLAVENYLIERIAHARHRANGRHGKEKILYERICKNVNATTPRQQQRLPRKVREYLDHFVKTKFIEKYTEEESGVTVYY